MAPDKKPNFLALLFLSFLGGGLAGFVVAHGTLSMPKAQDENGPQWEGLTAAIKGLSEELHHWQDTLQKEPSPQVAVGRRETLTRKDFENFQADVRQALSAIPSVPQYSTGFTAQSLPQIRQIHRGQMNSTAIESYARIGVQDEDVLTNKLLFWTAADLIRHFGTPIRVNPHDRGVQGWEYDYTYPDGKNVSLYISLHQGMVYRADGDIYLPDS